MMKHSLRITLTLLLIVTCFGTFAQTAKKFYKTAQSHVEAGNHQEAINFYTKAIEMDPQYADAYVGRAASHEQLKALDKAVADYKTATTFDAKNADIYYDAGRVYFALKQDKAAIEMLTKAIDHEKKMLKAYHLQVQAMVNVKDFTNAVAVADKAVDVEKTTMNYYLQGVANDSLKKYKEAEYSFGRAVFYDSKNEAAHIGLAHARMHQDKYDKALEACDKAIGVNAKSKAAYRMRSNVHYKKGDYPNAINDLSKVTTIDPKDVDIYFLRGRYYREFGQNENAINDFTKIIGVDANNYHAYYQRGSAYEAIAKRPEAVKDYERFNELAAKDPAAKKLMEEVAGKMFELRRESNKPTIVLVDPTATANNEVNVSVKATEASIKAKVEDENLIKAIKVNGTDIQFDKNKLNPEFIALVKLDQNTFEIAATDVYDNTTTTKYTTIRTEGDAPVVRLLAPYASDNGEIYLDSNDPDIYVEGRIKDESLIKMIQIEGANAAFVTTEKNPKFSATISIANKNKIRVKAIDIYGNEVNQEYTLNREGATISANNPMGKTWVIFIENSKYQSFASLDGPTKDVRMMKGAFAKYKIHNVIHKKNLSKEQLERFFSIELRDLVRSNKVNSLLVWYAGHGKFINETGYWIPTNAKRDDEFTYFNINSLKAGMQSYSRYITHTLVVTDACESGPSFYQAMRATEKERRCDDWQATKFKSSQVFSSAGYELASDNSQFTKTFSSALTLNPNSCIPIDKIVTKVKAAVKKNNSQEPKFGKIAGLEDEDGTFFFIKKD